MSIFNLIKRFIRWKFPSVQPVTTVELAEWLENDTIPDLIIIDARSEAEYAVSHLPGAKHLKVITPDAILRKSSFAYAHDPKIVVYCSIGYRSAKVAQQLQQARFDDVFNLEGGIFQWANEQRPLFKDGQSTQLVHPYNDVWGKLLNQ
ncbi:MAG: rhodanese-like domain-containing protein [Crinalium sp.]